MLVVLLAYGPESGRRLREVSASALAKLEERYPLKVDDGAATRERLIATVAIHAEAHRRSSGGGPESVVPGMRDLAAKIIKLGFQQASRLHHPDVTGGDTEAQKRLAQARDVLLDKAKGLPERFAGLDQLLITDKGEECRGPWSVKEDDDIPF